jgi:hypothetical protein
LNQNAAPLGILRTIRSNTIVLWRSSVLASATAVTRVGLRSSRGAPTTPGGGAANNRVGADDEHSVDKVILLLADGPTRSLPPLEFSAAPSSKSRKLPTGTEAGAVRHRGGDRRCRERTGAGDGGRSSAPGIASAPGYEGIGSCSAVMWVANVRNATRASCGRGASLTSATPLTDPLRRHEAELGG